MAALISLLSSVKSNGIYTNTVLVVFADDDADTTTRYDNEFENKACGVRNNQQRSLGVIQCPLIIRSPITLVDYLTRTLPWTGPTSLYE
mmetsp:Transcript_3249/g.7525  ORF Transcript_3249/g.7525 Transcript_3249/m.7525 type:complete len:89 (+) Transcript_3249:421-687(+)